MKAIKIAGLALIALLLIGLGLYLGVNSLSRGDYYGAVWDREAPDFTLRADGVKEVSLSDFRGEAVLLFFGYTHCPDICPAVLYRLKQVKAELGSLGDRVQVLFVTVDPERDTGERLGEYVAHFDSSFLGLTGTKEDIDAVTSSYNVYYDKDVSEGTDGGYLMNHGSYIYLITPKGELFLRYSYLDSDPEMMAKDIRKVLSRN